MFVKCPRCELNYIQEGEKMCRVCLSEIKGGKQEEEIEMCSVCNAAPILPGHDVCLSCLRDLTDHGEEDETDPDLTAASAHSQSMNIEAVSTMDEIIPEEDLSEKMPGLDEDEISLESVAEEEDRDDENDDLESDQR